MASKELISQLQQVCDDLLADYINWKARHWHIESIDFKHIHEYFDELTSQTLDQIDGIGEYIVSFGALAPATSQAVFSKSKVKAPTFGERDPLILLQNALDSAHYFKDAYTSIDDQAQTDKEYGVSNLVESYITDLDKEIYKLQAYLTKF